jgi:hypothetical protein
MALEGLTVRSLKEAATWWASGPPEGAIQPISLPQWSDEEGCEDEFLQS